MRFYKARGCIPLYTRAIRIFTSHRRLPIPDYLSRSKSYPDTDLFNTDDRYLTSGAQVLVDDSRVKAEDCYHVNIAGTFTLARGNIR